MKAFLLSPLPFWAFPGGGFTRKIADPLSGKGSPVLVRGPQRSTADRMHMYRTGRQ